MAKDFKLKSSDFENGKPIPSKFTCDSDNISPELFWENMPKGTKSFALIADDPDAPSKTWVHWVIYNIPSNVTKLERDFPKDPKLPDGTTQGITDFKRIGYGGPCPPSGTHRYYFKLYALNRKLDLKEGASKEELLSAMEDNIISQTELMGTYKRK